MDKTRPNGETCRPFRLQSTICWFKAFWDILHWGSSEKRLYNDLVNTWFLDLLPFDKINLSNGALDLLSCIDRHIEPSDFHNIKSCKKHIIFHAPQECPLCSRLGHFCCVSYLQNDCVERWSAIWNWFLRWHSWIRFLWTC